MTCVARVINFLTNVPGGSKSPLTVEGERLIKNKGESPIVQSSGQAIPFLRRSFTNLLGEQALQRRPEIAREMDEHESQGVPLTKGKLVSWLSTLVGDETLLATAASIDAFRIIPQLPAVARLVLANNQRRFVDGTETWSDYKGENRAAVQFLRNCLYTIYGSKRVENCEDVGPLLAQMEEDGCELSKLHVIRMIMALSDVKTEDLQKGLEYAQVIRSLKDCTLSENFKKAILALTAGDDILVQRLSQLDVLISSLDQVNSLEELDQEQFQELLSVFNPAHTLHSYITGVADDVFAHRFWSRLVYECDWGHWLGRKSTIHYHRLKVQEEVDDLPGDTYEEKWESYRELLSKNVAYQEPKQGMFIPAPPDRNGNPQHYRVAKEFISGEGMVAYLLVRAIPGMKDLPPILLFRGTTFSISGLDALSNFIADLEPCLGKTAYKAGKEGIFSTIESDGAIGAVEEEEELCLEVMGHSFGGVAGMRFIDDFVKRKSKGELDDSSLSQIRHINMTIFNSPALEEERALKFAERMDEIDDLQVHGTVYKTEGDSVHYAGVVFLGYGCDRSKVPMEVVVASGKDIDPHLTRFFNKAGLDIVNRVVQRYSGEEVEGLLSNKDNQCIECVRKIVGYILHILLRIYRFFQRLLCFWGGELSNLQEKTLRMTARAYLEEVNALIGFLNICISTQESKEEEMRHWITSKLDRWITSKCEEVGNATQSLAILEEIHAKLSNERLDQLLFSFLSPMMETDATAVFKEAVAFDELTAFVHDLIEAEIVARKAALATPQESVTVEVEAESEAVPEVPSSH